MRARGVGGQGRGTYLCQLHTGWIPQDGAVGLLVASIANELGVPDSEIMPAVDPLGKYGDGRPVVERGHVVSGQVLHFGDTLGKVLPKPMMARGSGWDYS